MRKTKMSFAGAVASGLALILALVVPSSAGAVQGADLANIDKAKQGTLFIHKQLDPENVKDKATGEKEEAPGKKLDGVEFKVTRLNYGSGDFNVSDPSHYHAAVAYVSKFNKGEKPDTFKVSQDVRTVVTGGGGVQGEAKFEDLGLGVYLVQEQPVTDVTKLKANGENLKEGTKITPSQEFVVLIPITSKDKTKWNYDVHVYPKNYSTEKPVKKVKDAGKNAGETITYTLSATPGYLAEKTQRKAFWIRDRYTNARLSEVTVESVKQESNSVDYTLDDKNTNDGEFVIKVNEPNKLVPGKPVVATITAKVKPIGGSNGVIVNDIAQWDRRNDEGSEENPDWNPGNKVVSYFGSIKVTKVDEDASSKPLKGAKFALYYSDKKQKDLKVDTIAKLKRVEVENNKEWETKDDGTVTISGLHVTDFADNQELSTPGHYYLVETEAPAGYVKLENAIEFELKRADKTSPEEIQKLGVGLKPTIVNQEVGNRKSEIPELPLTGGQGIALLAGLGVLIAGGAVYSARRNSRQS